MDECLDYACQYDNCVLGVQRVYGDVFLQHGMSIVNLDDTLAVVDCFEGDCDTCGFQGQGDGTLSGCDLKGASGACSQNGLVNLDDILAVLSAFGGNATCDPCPACGQGFAAPAAGGGADSPLDAARQIVAYLRTVTGAEDREVGRAATLAQVLPAWCFMELSEEERQQLIMELQMSGADSASDLASATLEQITQALVAGEN